MNTLASTARNALRSAAVGLILSLACGLAAPLAAAQVPPAYTYGPLLPLLMQTPENGWVRVNSNAYSSVWTPDDLEPLFGGATHPPSRIIVAWSGFAWDSNRGDIILYGGGHANYSGNDVYRWHSSNLQWERASLPSEIRLDPVSGWQAIDGVDNAPSSAHTYDNNLFLPIVDRFMTWGGAAFNNGGPYMRVSETNPSVARPVGPYLFDPNRADGNKVGGTTGSHVQRVSPHPEVVGGNMWQNRDMPKNLAGQTMPGNNVDGCTGYAAENGHDVVYTVASNGIGSALNLYRYQITDVTNPALDQVSMVGTFWVGTSGTTTCGYDPARKLLVRTGTNAIPFTFWDLTNPGPSNIDQRVQVDPTIASFQSWLASQAFDIQNCALEFDPVRSVYELWCGGGTVWELHEPSGGNTTSGWSIVQRPTPVTSAPTTGDQALSTLGKWRYAPYYDVWVALDDPVNGNVWMYKPVGWHQPVPPGDALPSVSIASPAASQSFAPRSAVTLTATASDPDGSVSRVEYYVNGAKVGQATSAPYTVTINPILVGAYEVKAVAVDNVGGMSVSTAVTFNVAATLTTTVLQRGLNGYAGVTDTYLDATAPAANHGSDNPLYLDGSAWVPLLRFGVFQSEGGPVPNGAVFQSATLTLNKQYYSETLLLYPMLKPWLETQACWNGPQAGTSWAIAGAAGAGVDYGATADALVSPSFNPGLVSFDVTARVQQWSDAGSNYGWRINQIGVGDTKQFTSSEYAADPTLRPKLTLVWSGGSTTDVPPTVSIAAPANGTHVTAGSSVAVAANASDVDGTVVSVQFLANGTPIGTATSAPWSVNWAPLVTGAYTLTAIATDNGSASTTSAGIGVTVDPAVNTTTVTMQRGVNGYAGVADTFLDRYLPTTVRGAYDPLYLDAGDYAPLVRFAIFQSEGGTVPEDATIVSATLALYKQYYADTVRLNALLLPWSESQATWNNRLAGVPWTSPGATAAGADYATTADALVSMPYAPGWVTFDVTPRVAAWAGGGNYGWRIAQASSLYGNKLFYSSETAADPTLRPKLTVVYSGGTSNVPPTVAISAPLDGTHVLVGAPVAFSASAQDSDGSVTKVEYFIDGVSIGSATAAPWTVNWVPSSARAVTATAVATDNRQSTATSAPVAITVDPSGTQVVLQRGLNGYAGAADTFLDRYLPTTSRGSYDPLYLDAADYVPLVRFAIYQSEGGPVPAGAVIDNATLYLYKQYYSDTLQLNALLAPWVESQATWSQSQSGVPWAAPGASASGVDYVTTPDAQVPVPYNPGWVAFDVTSRVAAWSAGNNNGWRMTQQSMLYGNKTFDGSEYAADPTLRPKLVILYH